MFGKDKDALVAQLGVYVVSVAEFPQLDQQTNK